MRPHRGRPLGRRLFLALMAAGTAALFIPRSLFKSDSTGSGSTTQVLDSEPTEVLKPKGRFRIYTVYGIPGFDPATWRFTVDGLVERPLSLTIDEVLDLPRESQISDFKCVTGWRVTDILWTGVRLKTLLDMARPFPNARAITFHSSEANRRGTENYLDSLSIPQATHSTVMLAYEMAGEELPKENGMPLRLVVPYMYGYKSVKWVNRLEFTEEQAVGYWPERGYPVDAFREDITTPVIPG